MGAEVQRRATDTTEMTRTQFTMWMEPHTPTAKEGSPGYPCHECVLQSGPMCMDRSYCQFKETGKTWRKIPPEDLI